VDVLRLLRDCKANFDPSVYGATPALIAAIHGHVKVLQFLRDIKTNFEAPMKDDVTTAYAAVTYGHINVLRFLRFAKVNFDLPVVVTLI